MADDSAEIVKEAQEQVSASAVSSGGGTTFWTNQLMQLAVAETQAMGLIRMSLAAQAAQMVLNTSPTEGGLDIASLMQAIKGGQTTLPETGITKPQ